MKKVLLIGAGIGIGLFGVYSGAFAKYYSRIKTNQSRSQRQGTRDPLLEDEVLPLPEQPVDNTHEKKHLHTVFVRK